VKYLKVRQCKEAVCEITEKSPWSVLVRQIIVGFLLTLVTYYVVHDIMVPLAAKYFLKATHTHHDHTH